MQFFFMISIFFVSFFLLSIDPSSEKHSKSFLVKIQSKYQTDQYKIEKCNYRL